MKSDGIDDLPATQPAAPSPTDATRTSQPERPSPTAATINPSAFAPQLRSPERYDILGEHGRGGLGRVSRAHDRELGRDIAIKELISRGNLSEVRFLREALITARLEHPGIVPVYEAGRWPDGTPFYAMKLVAGRSLRELIAERTTVDERIGLLHHVIAVADAIAYAHGRNIIHRDLKPANIIVGDFGETVVIDWGLAKDLTATEESTVGGGPFRVTRDDDLTSAGSILGTPAYMAPEQERGEPVDQRADVFAIGAMLWELCSLQKLPPSYAGQRHRILRRAGIDQDLATIIDKALDPDPARRYPDAAALAADLKAFKAGARIAARNYSLWAMLAHWTRRHRKLAVSIAAVLAFAVAGVALYVRSVATERDRADTALGRVEAAKDALTLEHAELLLRSDPTSGLSALASYRGPDTTRAMQIAAEARGRGVAHPILNAHSDTIHLLAGMPDGSILSVGEDRRIVLTKNDVVTTLADDVAFPVIVRYSNPRRMLAYSSTNTGAVLLDLKTQHATRLSAITPYAFAFTSDGSRIAILNRNSEITVWSTDSQPKLLWRRIFPRSGTIVFSGQQRIVVPISTGFVLTSLSGEADVALAASAVSFDVSAARLAIGDERGILSIFDIPSFRLLGSIAVCRERVADAKIVSPKNVVVFACQEGSVGVADYTPMLSIRERFVIQGAPLTISSSEDGHLAIILSDSNIAYIHDIDDQLTHRYEGQAHLTCTSAPTSTYHAILTGDIDGTIRVWDAPASGAYVVMRGDTSILRATISPDNRVVAAGASDGTVHLARLRDHTHSASRGHASYIENVRFMPNGLLLSYGFDGRVLVWRTDDLSIVRSFGGHRSRVEDIDLIDHGQRILSIGDDGRLLSWSPNNEDVDILFTTRLPLINLEALANNDTAVIADVAGSVWHVQSKNISIRLRSPDGDLVTMLRASPDGHLVAIGTEQGNVTILDSTNWSVRHAVKMDGPVRQAGFSPDNSRIALVSERHDIRLISLGSPEPNRWHETSLAARDVSFSPDGRLLAIVCRDGSTWLYSFVDNTWTYVRDHYTLTSFGRFSPDGRLFVSSDSNGNVVVRDIRMTLISHP